MKDLDEELDEEDDGYYITNRSDNPIIQEIVDLSGELRTIQEDILPDLRRQLSELTAPDYDPSSNADDDLRDQDIQFLKQEIVEHEKRVDAIRTKQQKLSKKYQATRKDSLC